MEPEDDDFVITDARGGRYMLFQNNKSLGKYRYWDDAFTAAQKQMNKDGFFANIFYMNERGTIDLLNNQGGFAQKNPLPSTLTLGLIAAGVVALGVVIYKTGVLTSGPWTPGAPMSPPLQNYPPSPGTPPPMVGPPTPGISYNASTGYSYNQATGVMTSPSGEETQYPPGTNMGF